MGHRNTLRARETKKHLHLPHTLCPDKSGSTDCFLANGHRWSVSRIFEGERRQCNLIHLSAKFVILFFDIDKLLKTDLRIQNYRFAIMRLNWICISIASIERIGLSGLTPTKNNFQHFAEMWIWQQEMNFRIRHEAQRETLTEFVMGLSRTCIILLLRLR